jgi:Ca2+-binding EF-hand superfamily protein
VRKAFLALDKDFDGFVTIEDFLHYFGTDPLEFEDL